MTQRIWLITGVSTGLGRSLAEAALKRGDKVIGTLRKEAQIAEFEALAPGQALACRTDLTDRERVRSAVTQAVTRAGGVDVVVNNAGYGLVGAAEEVSDAEARHQMETNFFGAWEVTQATLPYFRTQRRGHYINIASVAGFMGIPGMALYSASKFALEGLSESLAGEVGHLGIRVTIVEPGGFRTEWASGSAPVRAEKKIEDYASSSGRTSNALADRHGHQDGDPARAAHAIIQAVDAEQAPLRLVLGADALAMFRKKLERTIQNLDAWEAVSHSTSFDAKN